MAMGERIRFIRNLRGMTQKYLGIKAGLPDPSGAEHAGHRQLSGTDAYAVHIGRPVWTDHRD